MKKIILSLLLAIFPILAGEEMKIIETRPLPGEYTSMVQGFKSITPTKRDLRIKVQDPGTGDLAGYIVWFVNDPVTEKIKPAHPGFFRVSRGASLSREVDFPEHLGSYAGHATGVFVRDHKGVRLACKMSTIPQGEVALKEITAAMVEETMDSWKPVRLKGQPRK